MAEFREHYEGFRAINVDIAGISVDEPGHSEPMRELYRLPFPILCDTDAAIVKSWGLFNSAEKGGIAQSAVFLIKPGLRVKYCSIDTTTSRIRAAELLEYIRLTLTGVEAKPPERRSIVPTVGEVARSVLPTMKESLFGKKR